ncbi:MAG: hypothetical protein ACPG32_08910 [Akkermansiaceae bacterium]
MSQDQTDKNWMETSASFAPAVLGTAAGVILGDLMHRETRRPVALTLAALGLCALAPALVGNVIEKINGPETKRGTRRTLRNIRDAGPNPSAFPELEDELGELGDIDDLHVI